MSQFPLLHTVSWKRIEYLMNKMRHCALHDKSKELKGKRSYSTHLAAPSHSTVHHVLPQQWKQGLVAFCFICFVCFSFLRRLQYLS